MKTLPASTALSLALLTCLRASAAPTLLEGNEAGKIVALDRATPLEMIVVVADAKGTIEVRDGANRLYYSGPVDGRTSFRAGGALGTQTVTLRDTSGREDGHAEFTLDAQTSVDDGGKYKDMFTLFHDGMSSDYKGGTLATEWNGKTYHMFVNWVLDNHHTAKGMKYFSPYGTEFIDMMRGAQREDGMIWSNLNPGQAIAYYKTAYGPFDYVRKIGDRYFVRQPAENHPEYVYVSTIYQAWKACGDDAWMGACLTSAMRALDYCVKDPARWSERFQLLKRVYTIDSWDFQVDDAYTPDIGLSKTMLVDPKLSKFGVFFGDNVYYAAACSELAEMLDRQGRTAESARYAERGEAIRKRLDALSWNGRFFTHFIDEDPAVRRDLGVDERSQIAQGNAYALNRGIRPDQAEAIIRTYMELRDHLPVGSPGEWYAIYPPFQRGFGLHDATWQYMNGGVGGHVAGELARGAFEFGFEPYARDILDRLTALGHAHGNKIWFAYTGSLPPPPPAPRFSTVDLSSLANMAISERRGPNARPWMLEARPGDDIRGLPTGNQMLAGIPFKIADPAATGGRVAVAVSRTGGLPEAVDVPVNADAACLYLVHTSTKPTSEGVCGAVSFLYTDGSSSVQYIVMGKQLTYWWFPELQTNSSGVAWHGPSPVAADVGPSWCAIDNPHPERRIASVRIAAPADQGIYTVLGLTLADKPHYVPTSPVSYGGPDNWAAATAMAAMIEGLAGIKDGPRSETFAHPIVAPRWDPKAGRPIDVTVRYPASRGYVAYRYESLPGMREIIVTVTGGAAEMEGHFLLPEGVSDPKSVDVDGSAAAYRAGKVRTSTYVDVPLSTVGPRVVRIRY